MQKISNVNTVINVKDCIRDGSKFSGDNGIGTKGIDCSRNTQTLTVPSCHEDIPAVDSLDEILGRSGEDDGATNSFESAAENCHDENYDFDAVATNTGRDKKGASENKNLGDNVVRQEINHGAKPALLIENRKRFASPRKVTFNNTVQPIGDTTISPRSASLQRALERIRRYEKESQKVVGLRKPPTPYKSSSRSGTRTIRSSEGKNSLQTKGKTAAKPSQEQVSQVNDESNSVRKPMPLSVKATCPSLPKGSPMTTTGKQEERITSCSTMQDSKKTASLPTSYNSTELSSQRQEISRNLRISTNVTEKPHSSTCPKAPHLLTTEKNGERIYSCTTPEHKRHTCSLKSPINSHKDHPKQKTVTMKELRNKFLEDFRHFPPMERFIPRITVPKPFSLRTEERMALRHLSHQDFAYEDFDDNDRAFKALPVPDYEIDPLFHGVTKNSKDKWTMPRPFHLSSSNNTAKLRRCLDDERVGRYRFRALPVPDFSYKPSSASSHVVDFTMPFPFNLHLDQHMASRIRFNGTTRTNLLAKMYVRACSMINDKKCNTPEPKMSTSNSGNVKNRDFSTPRASGVRSTKSITQSTVRSASASSRNSPKGSISSSSCCSRSDSSMPTRPSPNSIRSSYAKTTSKLSKPTVTTKMPPRSLKIDTTAPSRIVSSSPRQNKVPCKIISKSAPSTPTSPPPKRPTNISGTTPRLQSRRSTTEEMSPSHVRSRSAPSTPTSSSPKSNNVFKARKMPDFSKPFVPVKKPPSPLKKPTTTPLLKVGSPREGTCLRNGASGNTTPTSSNSIRPSPRGTNNFKARKMPDFSKPFVPVKKPPSPLKISTLTPSRTTATTPRKGFYLNRGSGANLTPMSSALPKTKPPSPLSVSATTPSRTAATSSPRKGFYLNRGSGANLTPTSSTSTIPSSRNTCSLKPSVHMQKPPVPKTISSPRFTPGKTVTQSPKSHSSSSKVVNSESPSLSPVKTFSFSSSPSMSVRSTTTGSFQRHTINRISSDCEQDNASHADQKSSKVTKQNNQFSARPMPDFSKPFVPVKTIDIERALVLAVSKDKALLQILDQKLNDYKDRLHRLEFGEINTDLDGKKRIKQLADVIVKEVLQEVAQQKSPSCTTPNSLCHHNLHERNKADLSKDFSDGEISSNVRHGVLSDYMQLSKSSKSASQHAWDGTHMGDQSQITFEGREESNASMVVMQGILQPTTKALGYASSIASNESSSEACLSYCSTISPVSAKEDSHKLGDGKIYQREVNLEKVTQYSNVSEMNNPLSSDHSTSENDNTEDSLHLESSVSVSNHDRSNGDTTFDRSGLSAMQAVAPRRTYEISCQRSSSIEHDNSHLPPNSSKSNHDVMAGGNDNMRNRCVEQPTSVVIGGRLGETCQKKSCVSSNNNCSTENSHSYGTDADDLTTGDKRLTSRKATSPTEVSLSEENHEHDSNDLSICNNNSSQEYGTNATSSDQSMIGELFSKSTYEPDEIDLNSRIDASDSSAAISYAGNDDSDGSDSLVSDATLSHDNDDDQAKDDMSGSPTLNMDCDHANQSNLDLDKSYIESETASFRPDNVTSSTPPTHYAALQGDALYENTLLMLESISLIQRDECSKLNQDDRVLEESARPLISDQVTSNVVDSLDNLCAITDNTDDSKNSPDDAMSGNVAEETDVTMSEDSQYTSHVHISLTEVSHKENTSAVPQDDKENTTDIHGKMTEGVAQAVGVCDSSDISTNTTREIRSVVPSRSLSSTPKNADSCGDYNVSKEASSQTESSLMKVLYSLNQTIERINVIESTAEKKLKSSSSTKSCLDELDGERTDMATRYDEESQTDIVVFRAGWKRALELTDLVEFQDENVPPDKSKSPKLFEPRIIPPSFVKKEVHETRDDLVSDSRQNEVFDTVHESNVHAKQNYSLYDSFMWCCTGKGNLD